MQLDEQGLRILVRWLLEQLETKVDAEDGKGLSEENFTAGYRSILDGAYGGAEPGLVPDGQEAGPGTYLRADGVWSAVPETQSDWEEAAAASPAFIQNKPFGRTDQVVIPEETFTTGATGMHVLSADPGGMPEAGELLVTFDGNPYTLPVEAEYGNGGLLTSIRAGNRYFETGNRRDDTGEPLLILATPEYICVYTDAGRTHTVFATVSLVRTLDPEWLGMESFDPITTGEIDRLFAEAADHGEEDGNG